MRQYSFPDKVKLILKFMDKTGSWQETSIVDNIAPPQYTYYKQYFKGKVTADVYAATLLEEIKHKIGTYIVYNGTLSIIGSGEPLLRIESGEV